MISILNEWSKDPEFQALPLLEKQRRFLNYFDQELADDEFRALPDEEKVRIKGNFLSSYGIGEETSSGTSPTGPTKYFIVNFTPALKALGSLAGGHSELATPGEKRFERWVECALEVQEILRKLITTPEEAKAFERI